MPRNAVSARVQLNDLLSISLDGECTGACPCACGYSICVCACAWATGGPSQAPTTIYSSWTSHSNSSSSSSSSIGSIVAGTGARATAASTFEFPRTQSALLHTGCSAVVELQYADRMSMQHPQ
eukprot:GHVU01212542.1.p3 GENE.GHVU01212542.1~~GHVU01212542.1.p3  ORF type:complete len:123 (-),score=5.73 GHVU01212542.1:71-439(-)